MFDYRRKFCTQLNRYIALSITTRVYMGSIKDRKEHCTTYVSKTVHSDPSQPVNVNDSTWLCAIPTIEILSN